MRKLLLATTMLCLAPLAGVANADSVTGSYTAALGSGSDATLTDNLATSNFSLTLGAARSVFVTVNPGTCYTGCWPLVSSLTVTFSNLTADGHNFGGFTETGTYTANYLSQTDSIVWTGAVAQSGFGLDQDGNVPLVFTKALNGGAFGTLDINLVDGADWNVQTYVEANLVSVPAPLVGAGLPGLVAACASMLGLNWRRRRRRVDAAA
jgi:hypothetical protein